MTNFSHGRAAEAAAAEYLKNNGYGILSQNWRTRYCEIDIVAQKNSVIYFVEVKYRRSNEQGAGLKYVTTRKLKQMEMAARFWTAENNFNGDYNLAALEVSGSDYEITNFLDSLA